MGRCKCEKTICDAYSRVYRCMSLVLTVIIISSTVNEILSTIYSTKFISKKGVIMYCSDCIIIAISSLVGMFCYFWSRENMQSVFELLSASSATLPKKREGGFIIYCIILYLLLLLSIMVYDSFVWMEIYGTTYLFTMPRYLSHFMISGMLIKLILTIDKLSKHFGFLNKKLEKMLCHSRVTSASMNKKSELLVKNM